MPNRPVTVRRWEVAAGVLIYLAILALTLTFMQRSIDDAEKRIRENSVTNEQQDAVRRELLGQLRAADVRACEQTEALKTEFRRQALSNFERLEQNARLLQIPLTQELRLEAALARDRALERFRPVEC